jgi:hypothetical protein
MDGDVEICSVHRECRSRLAIAVKLISNSATNAAMAQKPVDGKLLSDRHVQLDSTQRSVVLAAGRSADGLTPQANKALQSLCDWYWIPIYAFIRRRGTNPADAEDLTPPGFFGWSRDGATIEIWREGTWYRWRIQTRGFDDQSQAPDLPPELQRFRPPNSAN